MPYLAAHSAIIDCGKAIISFPEMNVTLTCKKASNIRFSAIAITDPPDFISEFPEVFPPIKITELPPLRKVNHHLNLMDKELDPSPKLYTVPDKIIPAYCQIIDDWKAKGIIYSSEANNPVNVFPKPKPNSQICLLVDLFPRNAITIKDRGPIPNHSMILRAVARAKYRSTIELSNWYFQVRVSPEDARHNTIKTPFGSFACRVMLQGDTNAPATAM